MKAFKTKDQISPYVWKHKKTLNRQSNLEKEKWNWRNQPYWLQTILQSYSHQDSMVLAQRQKYRSMEQNRKPRDKSTHLWTPYLCDPKDCSPPGSSVHEVSPGKYTRVGCHGVQWRWLINTWKDAQHHSLTEKCKSKPQWGTNSHQSEWLPSNSRQTINSREGVVKRDPSYTIGGNAN